MSKIKKKKKIPLPDTPGVFILPQVSSTISYPVPTTCSEQSLPMCLKTLTLKALSSPCLENSYSHFNALSKCPPLCKANRHTSGLDKPLAEIRLTWGPLSPFLAEPCIGL